MRLKHQLIKGKNYRPLLAVVLVLAAVGLILGYKKLRAKAPAPQPAA